MRPPALTRTLLSWLSCVCACACGAAMAVDAPSAAGDAVPPSAALTPILCHSALAPAEQRVSVVSVMRHRPGTRTLSVRITLLQREPGGPARPVVGGDLGTWVTPAVRSLGRDPADVWRLDKVVYGVAAPAGYRFVVEFRWLGAGGRVLAQRTLSTGRCAVRQLAPDVLVRSVSVTPIAAHPDHERYVATIANRGASASGPFSVMFVPGSGLTPETGPVASLAPRARERVAFVGPACDAEDPPTVIADPDGQVHDADRADNVLTVTCPPA